jgi:fumarate hydratase class I
MSGALRHAALRASRRLSLASPASTFATKAPPPTPFAYQDIFEPAAPKDVPWRKLTDQHVSVHEGPFGERVLRVEPEALTLIARQGMTDIAHLLRPGHLQQLSNILADPEASDNDRFVALELLKNANVAAGMVLPGCQDTGTAIVMGKRGQRVFTDGDDEAALSRGVYEAYVEKNLRYSQVAPQDMFAEKNTGCNLPAQIDLYAARGDEYHFHFMVRRRRDEPIRRTRTLTGTNPSPERATPGPRRVTLERASLSAREGVALRSRVVNFSPRFFVFFSFQSVSPRSLARSRSRSPTRSSPSLLKQAKGGGSANKTFLYQETKALLNEERMMQFLEEKIKTLGTAACPPYHLAFVVGGLSAEQNLKTVKLASARYLDNLHESGNARGRAFRDRAFERKIHALTQRMGIGAQFGGKYFCHDVRVIRLPRHGASCPVGLGVSCSADRQMLGKITAEGVFLEQLETDPGKYLPEVLESQLEGGADGSAVAIDLTRPMSEIRETLSACSVSTRLKLTGPLIVARDIAHAKIKERLDAGEPMPEYMKKHAVYYAGPAKTPDGMASGSFGPTTAGRMDSYVEQFQAKGGSMVMLAKGNRSSQVTRACKKHRGFYLGSIGGPAAILARNNIKKVEVLEYPELGMEAVWKIEVEDFPAFVIVDDKGNDFFKKWQSP